MADSAHVAEESFDAWTTNNFERASALPALGLRLPCVDSESVILAID
jgi:hypothetical protein